MAAVKFLKGSQCPLVQLFIHGASAYFLAGVVSKLKVEHFIQESEQERKKREGEIEKERDKERKKETDRERERDTHRGERERER